jgi:hypothetical protein
MPGKAGGPNLRHRLIDINGSAGALVTVLATGPTRGWHVRESIIKKADGSAVVPQGFTILVPNDGSDLTTGFAETFARSAAAPATEPGDFPFFENFNWASEHGANGDVFGGAANATPGSGIDATTATVLFKIRSLTATATTVEVTEYF